MPQHSYKQLAEAYQRGVNKEHKSKCGKHEDGRCPQPPPGRPRATPRKAEGQQHGPAHTSRSTW